MFKVGGQGSKPEKSILVFTEPGKILVHLEQPLLEAWPMSSSSRAFKKSMQSLECPVDKMGLE